MISTNKKAMANCCIKGLIKVDGVNTITHPRKSHLWLQGEKAENIYFIESGFVDVYTVCASGEEKLIGLFGPGNAIGLSATLNKTNYPAFCRAQTKVTVIKIPYYQTIQKLTSQTLKSTEQCFRRLLVEHQNILFDKIQTVSSGPLEDRLNTFFKSLVDRFGTYSENNTYFIALPLTKTQIAKYIDVRVETMIRHFSQNKSKNHIVFKPDGIVVHNDFLN